MPQAAERQWEACAWPKYDRNRRAAKRFGMPPALPIRELPRTMCARLVVRRRWFTQEAETAVFGAESTESRVHTGRSGTTIANRAPGGRF
jgi:hypothetical protein